ncbi:MAG TPA: hypothetical protein DEV81_03815 [Cyanobacteria bacterium UBA11049]|nr:hypothetical protein [Cyanobacteria bacterium UBA11049]
MKPLRKVNDIYLSGSLLLVGLLLRLPSLRLGLWRDEGSTYFDALPTDLSEVIKTVTLCELNPPGFYLLMHQWMQWFGAGEVVFKLPALIFALLTIAAVYILGRVVGSPRIGFVAAALTTIAPEAIYYSQEARPYSLTALLSCLVVLLYCKALTSKHQKWYLFGFVLCASLLLYVQYTGLLLVGSLAVITPYLLWRRKGYVKIIPFALSFAAVFLLFTPWLPVFLTHLHTGSPWHEKIPLWMVPKRFIVNLIYFLPVWKHPIHLLFFVVLAGWLLFQTAKFLRLWRDTPMAILVTIMGLGAILVAALSYSGRYVFFLAPIAWILYSSCVIALWRYFDQIWKQYLYRFSLWGTVLLMSACLWLVYPNLSYALSVGNVAKSGLRSLAADAIRNPSQQIFYVLAPDHLAPAFGYYESQDGVPFYGFARWDRPELFRPQGYADIWQDPALLTMTMQRIQDKAKQGYSKLGFIRESPPEYANEYPYQPHKKTDQLLSRLRQTYPLVGKTDYPGKAEFVTLYLFDLRYRN